MPDPPPAATEVRLNTADATELADLLTFLRQWLSTSHDADLLTASLDRFPGSAGADTLPVLLAALSRFAPLLAPPTHPDF